MPLCIFSNPTMRMQNLFLMLRDEYANIINLVDSRTLKYIDLYA